MRRNASTTLWAYALTSLSVIAATPASAVAADRPGGQVPAPLTRQVVGYFTQWGIDSGFYEKSLITSGEIDSLTEIDYAFGGVSADGTCTSTDPGDDYQRLFTASEAVDGVADRAGAPLAGNFNQLRELKRRYPKLKIVMTIGGFTGSGRFSAMAQTAESRAGFVASCIDQYIKGDLPGLPAGAAAGIFDGIAIDWEYPDQPGDGNAYSAQDIPDFTALMQEFRTQLDRQSERTGERYLLTADTAQFPQLAAQLQLAQLAKSVDWFNVMTADFYGGLEPNGPTDFASGLYQDPGDPYPAVYQFDVDKIVQYYESQGVPAEQICIDIPYYAHLWTGVAPGPVGDGLFQSATGGGATMDYNQVVTEPGTTYFDPATGEPYKYDPATQTFYTYDDPASVALKGRYIVQHDLRGTMIWSLDGDTSDGRLTAALGASLGTR